VTTFRDFISCNFIVVANLEKMRITDGNLQLKLKFRNALDSKLVLIWMPVTEKKIVFDKNLDVTVE